jgi:hypothetical protein
MAAPIATWGMPIKMSGEGAARTLAVPGIDETGSRYSRNSGLPGTRHMSGTGNGKVSSVLENRTKGELDASRKTSA